MTTPAIRVRNLGKHYQLGARERGYTTFREALTRAAKAPFHRFRNLSGRTTEAESFWALKDVSFDIAEGEVVGIIGRNGAGKSTLLKILSQITEPTTGEIELHGRVGSLLEVGTGFHPELSGRENIYLNGAILGMKREEISRRFDEIVEFAEIEEFLDTPVKRYSSGMYTRLAFSVAAHLEPEILIVDEVLAVGDASFQKKCLGKMSEVGRTGRTVLFVSHNMMAVESLCNRVIILESGRTDYDGDQLKAIRHYFGRNRVDNESGRYSADNQSAKRRTSEVFICRAEITCNRRDCKGQFAVGAPLEFMIECSSEEPTFSPSVGIGIENSIGQRIVTFHTKCDPHLKTDNIQSRRFRIFCCISDLALIPGDYSVALAVESSGKIDEYLANAMTFTILPTDYFENGGKAVGGVVYSRQKWTIASA